MTLPLFISGLIIMAASGLIAFNYDIKAWFNALPSNTRADIVLIVVCVSVLAAWGVS